VPRAAARTKIKKGARTSRPLARERAPKLLVQPEDGIAAIIQGLDRARQSIDILIFRFDHRDIEQALLRAVKRGVRVRALIAYTNRGGEKHLRALEMRMLAAGITVARSAADMARYHGKMIIVDASRLYVLGFNFTYLDIEHSRSFGVIITDHKLVRESVKLFEADMQRHSYTPNVSGLLVSPVNARDGLASFIAGAKKELLIYDPNVSDSAMLRILTERSKAGVQIRILGRAAKLPSRKMPQIRLHARAIVRDGTWVSLGSQSLRTLELDGRSEVGVVFRNPASARRITAIFQHDWDLAAEPETGNALESPDQSRKIAKKVAKAVTKELPPVAEVLDLAVKEVVGDSLEVPLNPDVLQDTVTDAVKRAVKEVVRDAVEEVTEHSDKTP